VHSDNDGPGGRARSMIALRHAPMRLWIISCGRVLDGSG
jgi:hypothetical protein